MTNNLRTPIVAVLGHVDHGKTSILDRVRGTTVAEKETGLITQHIGATEVSIEAISKLCGSLTGEVRVPGLLFIDTPGHHAFTTLRARGGALANIAILVVDINEGFQPQTIESINILKQYKTPFIVAANKIDKIHGWFPHSNMMFIETFKLQGERARNLLDDKIYILIEKLSELNFSSDRYDRIRDFTNNVGIVPVSAKTGEGIPDLLMVSVGLAQKFLQKDLRLHAEEPAMGTVLEIKEERGYGTTLDTIIYDGVLKVGDKIVIGSSGKPIITKIRALLKPDIHDGFKKVKKVTAAAGVKISAPNIEKALAGAPLRVINGNAEESVETIQKEMGEIDIHTQEVGVIIKADTIGSLEALAKEIESAEVPVSKAGLGGISRRDVIEAETVKDPLFRVVIGFNIDVLPDAQEESERTDVVIFTNDVIYRLIEDYTTWMNEQKTRYGKKLYETIVRPGKFRILPGCIFRQSKPAIVGVEVVGGTLRTGVAIIKDDGTRIGILKDMQDRGEHVSEIGSGKEVAISIEGPTVGRQINEGDLLYVDVPEKHAKIIEQELYDALHGSEMETLEAFLEIKRESNPFWAK
ncbi:MAG TPA: translation initiation factor IF-2 [Candidatus Acidoferrum sp.]|nr:translation initiation factor IF-2 [Candidatus Acidoferrum sp.]